MCASYCARRFAAAAARSARVGSFGGITSTSSGEFSLFEPPPFLEAPFSSFITSTTSSSLSQRSITPSSSFAFTFAFAFAAAARDSSRSRRRRSVSASSIFAR